MSDESLPVKSGVASTLTYPMPAMQAVIDSIRADIRLMRQWHGAPQRRAPQAAITEVTPVTVLDTLEAVVESVEPALRFFLNHPTQRLSIFLRNFVDDADAFVSWLSTQAGDSHYPSLSPERYQEATERLQASLRDWHNAIVLAGIAHELDMDTPEVQH